MPYSCTYIATVGVKGLKTGRRLQDEVRTARQLSGGLWRLNTQTRLISVLIVPIAEWAVISTHHYCTR